MEASSWGFVPKARQASASRLVFIQKVQVQGPCTFGMGVSVNWSPSFCHIEMSLPKICLPRLIGSVRDYRSLWGRIGLARLPFLSIGLWSFYRGSYSFGSMLLAPDLRKLPYVQGSSPRMRAWPTLSWRI